MVKCYDTNCCPSEGEKTVGSSAQAELNMIIAAAKAEAPHLHVTKVQWYSGKWDVEFT